MGDAYFTQTDEHRFVGTEFTRGPWDAEACHAGPPTGLLARAVERLFPEQRLVRLTVDLDRPIPMVGFRIVAETVKSGRSVSASAARIIADDGQVCARAAGLHLLAGAVGESLPTVEVPTPDLASAQPGLFPVRRTAHGLPAFATSTEVRYPLEQNGDPGPTTMWMKTVPLLGDETPSPFQKICPLADCGNALSRNAELTEVSFVNPDLTVVLHREPEGDWLGSQATSHWQSDRVGMADALLFDERGPVGRACQTLLLRPAGG